MPAFGSTASAAGFHCFDFRICIWWFVNVCYQAYEPMCCVVDVCMHQGKETPVTRYNCHCSQDALVSMPNILRMSFDSTFLCSYLDLMFANKTNFL